MISCSYLEDDLGKLECARFICIRRGECCLLETFGLELPVSQLSQSKPEIVGHRSRFKRCF